MRATFLYSIFAMFFLLVLPSCRAQIQTCGMTDRDGVIISPDEFVFPYPIPDNWSPVYEFWETRTVNVNRTSVTSDGQTKYITALKYSTRYTMKTTAAFANFIDSVDNTDNGVITRRSNFECMDASVITYTFRIPVEISDKERPIFQNPGYNFSIRADWPSTVSMNQGRFIIVGDRDRDVENARLTFSVLPAGVVVPVGVQLWSDDNPPTDGQFNYRVELYYRPDVGKELESGKRYEFSLTASSRRLEGEAKIGVDVV